ncbi:MAG: hypothetical protein WD470_10560 [Rhodospirillaceae bacterium]
MVEIALLIVAFVIIVIWIGATIAALPFAILIIAVWFIGDALELAWWQTLLAAFFSLGVLTVIVEKKRESYFKQHAHRFGLSPSDFGRQVEIEGKVHTIKGMAGDKVVVQGRAGEFAKKIDPTLVVRKLKA